MIILRITAKAKPEKEYELRQAIKSALDKTTKFEDVKKCFCKSVLEENIFHIEQEWCDVKNLETYLLSREHKFLLGAITVLGELQNQDIIKTDSVSSIE